MRYHISLSCNGLTSLINLSLSGAYLALQIGYLGVHLLEQLCLALVSVSFSRFAGMLLFRLSILHFRLPLLQFAHLHQVVM